MAPSSVERNGCLAGYPEGRFRGKQAMTRYEATALLNACLDRVTEVTDQRKRLLQEFEVAIDRLYYQFPIGSSLTATLGARVQ